VRDLSPSVEEELPRQDLIAAIPRLRRYARVLTGTPHRADDLVQDTLARAWAKRKLWRVGSDLRAWLFTIMHHLHVNQRAAAWREVKNISLDGEGEYDVVSHEAQEERYLSRIELREVMQRVSRLPPDQREILLLVAVEELRYHEVAAVLGIPIGTVMSRLSRARHKLRRMAMEPAFARNVAKR